ncbi:MAG TPA: hypothetical protein VFU09_13020 [Candidatus Udaeobacter sp.]|nr:hypothetical protein [Candidatus Udaeobacter sp.]
MKRMILPIVTSCLIASSVHAVPLTWDFRGTTISPSVFNGTPIVGLPFELRIFLDTNLVGTTFDGLSDVFFDGPHQGEVEIATLGVLPVSFTDVEYFAPSLAFVTGVQFTQFGKSFILFPSSISSDPLHLTPIAPTAPIASSDTVEVLGPNGLDVFGKVATFSATTVPEAGSTALLLTSALVTLGFLRRRINAISE